MPCSPFVKERKQFKHNLYTKVSNKILLKKETDNIYVKEKYINMMIRFNDGPKIKTPVDIDMLGFKILRRKKNYLFFTLY